MAFGSLVDVLIVLSNVVALVCGGVWALLLDAHQFQHLGRGRVSSPSSAWRSWMRILQVSVIPSLATGRQTSGRGDHPRLAAPLAADHDDRPDGDLRAAAGGVFHADRRPDRSVRWRSW